LTAVVPKTFGETDGITNTASRAAGDFFPAAPALLQMIAMAHARRDLVLLIVVAPGSALAATVRLAQNTSSTSAPAPIVLVKWIVDEDTVVVRGLRRGQPRFVVFLR
jgi:hypothetical protein